MIDMDHTVHVSVGGATATIASTRAAPVEWVKSYFGPWWPPAPGPAYDGPTVKAFVDPSRYEELERVACASDKQVLYARAPTWLVDSREHGRLAVTPSQQVAYHRDVNGDCAVVGTSDEPVSMGLARITREAIRAHLQATGWVLVHASVVVDDSKGAVLALGSKGAGKSSVALGLATTPGWRLLANDRAFAKATGDRVELLPWPAAAALGLGLLDAHHLTDLVRARLFAGDTLHPTTDPAVPAAILTGSSAELRDRTGRELKAQFHPRQLQDWLGLHLTRTGVARAVIHPQIDLEQPPTSLATNRTITEDDFFHGATEDRYPDILSLHTQTEPKGWVAVHRRLEALPQATARLGHDIQANRHTLTAILRQLTRDSPPCC